MTSLPAELAVFLRVDLEDVPEVRIGTIELPLVDGVPHLYGRAMADFLRATADVFDQVEREGSADAAPR